MDVKTLLRNNKIKIKDIQGEKLEFFNPNDTFLAKEILSKNNYQVKVKDNSISILSKKSKSLKEEVTSADVSSDVVVKKNKKVQEIQRRLSSKIAESVNFKEIVYEFDKITNIKIKNETITVFGFINSEPTQKEYSYSSSVVAKAVKKKLENFKR